jgi:prepilin-type N-terminal cleavage/methylation domain-containing protein
MRYKKGFTLVELLVVIAIIAVLLAILLPALASVKEKGKRIQCGYNLSSISKSINFYADHNDGKLLHAEQAHPYVAYRSGWFKPGSTTALRALNLACLYDTGIITDARTFYCPACTEPTYKWESYNNPMPWERLPKVFQAESGNQWVRTGYIYRPMDKKWNAATRTYGYPDKLVDVNYNKPWVVDTLWTRDSLNHVAGNRNVAMGVYAAFPDGHVNFSTNPEIFSDEYWVNDTTQLRPDTWQFQAVIALMEP